uniref:HAT C-terminal dimerisation domain-containing protein n=1 Tax=Moniliophthora roreri TaxID=221103 RepID=A0A0W0FHU3_MONRR
MASTLQQPVTPPQPATAVHDNDWADNALGFDQREECHGTGTVEAEVTEYLKDSAVVLEGKSGLLRYWKNNCTKYPTIFVLAIDLLPI